MSENDLLGALRQAHDQYAELRLQVADNTALHKKVDLLASVLLGNGDVGESVVFQVLVLWGWRKAINKWVERFAYTALLLVLGFIGALIVYDTPVAKLFGR